MSLFLLSRAATPLPALLPVHWSRRGATSICPTDGKLSQRASGGRDAATRVGVGRRWCSLSGHVTSSRGSRVLTRVLVDPDRADRQLARDRRSARPHAARAFALLGRYVTIPVRAARPSARRPRTMNARCCAISRHRPLLYLATAIALPAATPSVSVARACGSLPSAAGSFRELRDRTSPDRRVDVRRPAVVPAEVAICALLAWSPACVEHAPVQRAVQPASSLVFAGLAGVSHSEDNRTPFFLYELRTSPESAWVHTGTSAAEAAPVRPDAARRTSRRCAFIRRITHAARTASPDRARRGRPDQRPGAGSSGAVVSIRISRPLEMLGTLAGVADGHVDGPGSSSSARSARRQPRYERASGCSPRRCGNNLGARASDVTRRADGARRVARWIFWLSGREIDRRQAALHSEGRDRRCADERRRQMNGRRSRYARRDTRRGTMEGKSR